MNRRIKLGEFCQVGGVKGVIEDIGLTATQLRPADRSWVTLPNASIMEAEIINYSRRERYPFTQEIRLQRSPGQAIDRIMETLQGVCTDAPLLTQVQVRGVECESIPRELLQGLQSLGSLIQGGSCIITRDGQNIN